ncbi:MAG: hypothetical protein ACPG7F_02855 [Aggregatilineales bacterium]
MAVEVNWYDDTESVLHWQFIGQWHRAEYFEHLPTYKRLGSVKPHMLAVILDFRRNKSEGRNALTMFRSGESESADNVEIVVIVGNTWINSMVNLYSHIHGSRFQLKAVPTLEDALGLIYTLRGGKGILTPRTDTGSTG